MQRLLLLLMFSVSFSAAAARFECVPDNTTARRNKEARAQVTFSGDQVTFTSFDRNGKVVIPLAQFEREDLGRKFTGESTALTSEGESYIYLDEEMMAGRNGILNLDVEAYDIGKMVLIYGVYSCAALP